MFKLQANKNQLNLTEVEQITSGSSGAVYECKFCFSEDWYGTQKTVVFRTLKGRKEVMVKSPLNSDTNTCMIPAQVLTAPGVDLYCGVYGKRGDTYIIPTVWANLGEIKQGVDMGEDGETSTVTGVTSFNYRTGDVMPQAGDYTPDMIGAVAASGGTITDSLKFMVKNEEEVSPELQSTKQYRIAKSSIYTEVGGIEVTQEGVMLTGLKIARQNNDAISMGQVNEMMPTPSEPISNQELEELLK